MEVIIATRGVCEGVDAVASRVESGEARAENQQQMTSQHTDEIFCRVDLDFLSVIRRGPVGANKGRSERVQFVLQDILQLNTRRRRRRDNPRHPRETFSRRVAILGRRRCQPVCMTSPWEKKKKPTKMQRQRPVHRRICTPVHAPVIHRDSTARPEVRGLSTAPRPRAAPGATPRAPTEPPPRSAADPSASAHSDLLSERTGGQAVLNVGPAIADGGAWVPRTSGVVCRGRRARTAPRPRRGLSTMSTRARAGAPAGARRGGFETDADLSNPEGFWTGSSASRGSRTTTSHMRWSTSTSIPSIHVVSSANDEEFCLDSARRRRRRRPGC